MIRVTYTHKAWFGICPIYVGNLASESPHMAPREVWCGPLMLLMTGLCDVADWVLRRFGRQLVVAFVALEELDRPVVREYPDDG